MIQTTSIGEQAHTKFEWGERAGVSTSFPKSQEVISCRAALGKLCLFKGPDSQSRRCKSVQSISKKEPWERRRQRLPLDHAAFLWQSFGQYSGLTMDIRSNILAACHGSLAVGPAHLGTFLVCPHPGLAPGRSPRFYVPGRRGSRGGSRSMDLSPGRSHFQRGIIASPVSRIGADSA